MPPAPPAPPFPPIDVTELLPDDPLVPLPFCAPPPLPATPLPELPKSAATIAAPPAPPELEDAAPFDPDAPLLCITPVLWIVSVPVHNILYETVLSVTPLLTVIDPAAVAAAFSASSVPGSMYGNTACVANWIFACKCKLHACVAHGS